MREEFRLERRDNTILAGLASRHSQQVSGRKRGQRMS